jgi:hypothetical protein
LKEKRAYLKVNKKKIKPLLEVLKAARFEGAMFTCDEIGLIIIFA